MQAATDAGSIATAMSYVATSAKDAGVDINKLTGYIASVGEVSQAGAEQVGTFLKTMFARASAIKEGKLVDPETQEDISSVEVALQNVGIHLRDAQGEFRNTGEVLDEVAGKWSNMSNTTQAAVASAFAGTRQIDKFRILMSHYGTATEYATEATNSFGFATEKFNNTYLKGVEASQDKLKASFEQVSQDLVNSDFLSFLMRGGAEIINVIDAVTTKIGSIPTIAGVIGITKLIKDIKGFKGTVNGTLGLIGEDATTIKNFQGVASGTMSVNASQTLAASYANVREQLLLLDDAQRKAVMSELQRQGVDVQAIGLNEANAASMVRLNRTKAAEALYDANISEFQRRYAAQQILELDSTGALTQEKLSQIYASAGLRDAELEEATARSTNTSAINKEIGAGGLLKGAKNSIGNFLGSTGGKLTLIGAAIYAAYKAISYVAGTSDRAFGKFTDKTNELEQANSNVEEATNKLSALRSKIEELQALSNNGTITLTQQKDLDNLQLENSQLEAQLATLKEIAKAKEEAAAQSAYSQGKDYLNGTDTKGEGRWWKSFLTFGLNGGATWDVDMSHGASINDAIDKITRDQVASANIGKDGKYDGKSQQWYEEDLTAQSQFLSNSLDNLQSFHAAMKYYDNAANQQQKDSNEEFLRQQEYIVRMIMAINPESGAQSAYNYVTNDKNNSAAKSKLDVAAKNGDLSGKDLKKLYSSDKDVKAYADQLSKLLNISLDDNGFIEMANGINKIKQAADGSTEQLTELGQTFDKLSVAKTGIEKLSKAHKELAKNGEISFSTLADIQKTFADGVPDIDKYIAALAGMKGNNKEAYKTLTQLALKYIENKVGIENMTDANKGYIKSMLDEMGVTNSDAIATYAVASAKGKLAVQTAITSGSISSFISNLGAEAGQCGLTKAQLAMLAAQMIATSNTNLNFSQQIGALRQLAAEAGVSQAYISSVLDTSVLNKQVTDAVKHGDMTAAEAKDYVAKSSASNLAKKIADMNTVPVAKYAPASSGGSKGNGGGSSEEPYKADIDDFYKEKEKITELGNAIDLLKDRLDMLTSDDAILEYLRSFGVETDKTTQKTSLFKQQVDILNAEIEKYSQQQDAYHAANEARRKAILSNVSDLRQEGFVVDYDANANKLLFENRAHLNELNAGSVSATNKLIKKYEELIKKTESLNDDNIEASKKWYDLKKSIEDTKKEYDDLYDKIVSAEKNRIDVIKDSISHEKDALEKEKELYEDEKNRVEVTVKVIQDAIDKKKDALQEANDALERQLDLEKKLEALEKAKDQRNKRIYHKGTGFEWDYDASEIKSLQEDYDEQKKKNDFDDKIKALEKQKKKWQEVLDSYQKKLDTKDTADVILQKILGYAWSGDYADVPITAITEFTDYYGKQCDQLNKDVDGSVAKLIKNLEDLSDQWDDAEYQIENTANNYEGKLEEVKAFEKLNFDDRLAYIKNFVSQAKAALLELAQLEGRDSSGDTGTTSGGDTTAKIGSAFGDTLEPVDSNLNPITVAEANSNTKAEMEENSAKWYTATPSERKELEEKNAKLGASIGLTRGDDGVWRDSTRKKLYANGGVNDFTGLAMLHGTPSAAETIFNSSDSKKLYDYVHTNSILNDRLAAMNILNNNQFKGITTGGGSSSITIESGAIVLNGVEDTDTLANAIVTELAPKLRQKLYNNK